MNNKEKLGKSNIYVYRFIPVISQVNQFLDSQNLETEKGHRNNFIQDEDFKIWRIYVYISRTDHYNNAINNDKLDLKKQPKKVCKSWWLLSRKPNSKAHKYVKCS